MRSSARARLAQVCNAPCLLCRERAGPALAAASEWQKHRRDKVDELLITPLNRNSRSPTSSVDFRQTVCSCLGRTTRLGQTPSVHTRQALLIRLILPAQPPALGRSPAIRARRRLYRGRRIRQLQADYQRVPPGCARGQAVGRGIGRDTRRARSGARALLTRGEEWRLAS